MAKWDKSIDIGFWDDLDTLDKPNQIHTLDALTRMLTDPFSPELRTEQVTHAEHGVYSCRASESLRIIWKSTRQNEMIICLVDQHDDAYNRAMRLGIAKEGNQIKIIDRLQTETTSFGGGSGLFTPLVHRIKSYGDLFISYNDEEIKSCGVPEELFGNIRALDRLDQFAQFEERLGEKTFYNLLKLVEPDLNYEVLPDEQITASLIENQGGENIYRFEDDEEFKRVLFGSLEDWMLFLAFDQKTIIRREFNGPVRIKGVAGSGKTVIAIHRARYLAKKAQENGKKVLFLTYGNRLPDVLFHLLTQLVGDGSSLLDHIECRTIHSWCTSFLHENKVYPKILQEKSRELLKDAISKVSRMGVMSKNLEKRGHDFFEDEIRYIIKGKALKKIDDYLSLERSGRGTRLTVDERQAVWKIYEDYQSGLQANNWSDFDDIILQALRLVEEGKLGDKYQSIIVDEIQDLTEATMKLIRAIVQPGMDDLFLVGDGLQKIYPGGYSMNQVGIDITGRGRILRKNYRNTQQILQAAHAMMEGVQYDDPDGEPEQSEVPEYSVRQGKPPVLTRFSSPEQEIFWIQTEIDRLVAEGTYSDKDFALLYRMDDPYKDLIINILSRQHEVVELNKNAETYFGPGIKLTTFHSAKGLEFKVVFVVGVTDGWQVPRDNFTYSSEEMEDYLAMEKRLLYVAMTRARDLLYITCSRGQPSRFLNGIPERMLERKNL